MSSLRTEHDAFGPVLIPADRYWGAQTQRALEVFGTGREQFPTCLIRAFGQQKHAAFRANLRLGVLPSEMADALLKATLELANGKFDQHFPLSIWQTGSGTQTNMNANEVIANRANTLLGNELGSKFPVHPNDHVNRSQSSNDSFPTVMHLTTTLELRNRLLPALSQLRDHLNEKAHVWQDVLKIGRTHMMDAVPMSQGQAFESFAHQVAHGMARIEACMPRLRLLPQGGTAVGTGLNTPVGFDVMFCEELTRLTGEPFETNPCKFEGMGTHDALVEVSGALNVIAVSLTKIANDIRLLGSGPRCGFGELVIPDDGLTSSIMPGKRNPTIAEVLAQAAMQVMGNHTAITLAGASSTFELNVAKPVLIYNLLQSIDVLTNSVGIFTDKLIKGLDINRAQLSRNVEHSLLMATVLNPVLGYDKVVKITQKAALEGISPKEAALSLGFLTADEYHQLVRPEKMTSPS
ncbi:class II fumarate hydratase [Pseudomonas gingeri]|uniref:class II fumarate hydratase n=1 Tax=Pseudomonas gingeri TaxID=117681 RepID=UPI0015A2D748|nr:class II fumarate hydratase [Pseudomonas gingeri]NWD04158.1 class II fumarate hydratase [Pseudomonas gingeri]NWE34210.1 class II fumarate hydratase [Pseudomonas gingeri]NWE56538.1 class II fumarate hydratase [Pseudomonas gingeri]NWF05754.1 class II fumarate hydratase [Pseudomonas gingeri]